MAVTRAQMVTRVRRRLSDKSTRRDGTAITTPKWSDSDIYGAVNETIKDRQPLIIQRDSSWYRSVLDFIGVTDAIASSSSTTLPIVANEQYPAPSNMLTIERLARRDQTNFPTVRLVDFSMQDTIYANGNLYAPSAEEANAVETFSLVTYNASGTQTNRIRIKPAPASTSYLYRVFFQRTPTEPSADGHTLDLPPDWEDFIALDVAASLASDVGDPMAASLLEQRDAALAVKMESPSQRNAWRRVVRNARP